MPAYSFEAMQSDGGMRRGVVEAESARAVRGMLRGQSLVPLAVAPVHGDADSPTGQAARGGRIFSAPQLAVWTRQAAGLLSSGLPLERALAALADEAEDAKHRRLVAALRAEVNGGTSLARAMASHPRDFPAVYVAVIEAGEHSGRLGQVLERLADELDASQALRSKLTGAALYPAIVTLVSVVIVVFLMAYVVPQVAGVFAGSKRALPLLTVLVLGLSESVRSYGWVLPGVFLTAAVAARLALKHDAAREQFDAWLLTLPWLGRIARDYNAARFAATLAMLAAAGVPILKALQAAAETLSNHAMRADARDAILLVREGAPLASAMARKNRFPGLLGMFTRLGEQTGQLPVMLQRAAALLSAEVQRRAMALATLLEPLLILAMGLVVMVIVLAVLLPIIQLSQWVK
jgi:general secretion pathway protein F